MCLCEEHRAEEMVIIWGAFTAGRAQFSALGMSPLGETHDDGSGPSVTSFRKWKIGVTPKHGTHGTPGSLVPSSTPSCPRARPRFANLHPSSEAGTRELQDGALKASWLAGGGT